MSALQGQELLEPSALEVEPAPLTRPVRPVRPVSRPTQVRLRQAAPAASPRAAAPRSGAAAWATAVRLDALPVTLVGAAVGGLAVARSPQARPLLLTLAVTALVAGHLAAGLVRSLGDPRPDRAGELRRTEAGRAVLGLVVVLSGLLLALVVLQGPFVLALGAAGAVLVVTAASRGLPPAALGAAGAAGGALATLLTGWAATGALASSLLLAALAAGTVVGAVLCSRRGDPPVPRALVVAPYAAVALAVGLHALAWPALLVGAALPAARKAGAAVYRGPAPGLVAGHGRLVAVLLVAGLVVAASTGV
jgi:1,4-dihydroxy-2-naphthoate octaprenyltransferase